MVDQPEPIPSATVVPLRDRAPDGDGQRLEVLMVRRSETIAYGGMWAFPGGRVDPGDLDPDRASGDGSVLAAARRAAVREAAEEIGLAFPPDSLVPLSHWTGGSTSGRRRLFAAWYFLAPAPDGAVVLDGRELLDHRWISPGAALAARERGEIEVVAPTWMTLRTLATAGSVADALALAAGREPVVYVSRMTVLDDDRRIVLWDGDAGYETHDPGVPGARHRLTMDAAGWRFERT
jgi:8-oxo-dGTP pyrophosphatase MutT (NUDIX family)